ncbi:MAG: histone deacetylase, partial [Methanoregula sp.]|nr:histone deacetylase [Methanoregula sp.]
MPRCCAITSPICARHDNSGHPESNARLDIACTGIPQSIPVIQPECASLESIMRVHNPYYLEWLQARCAATTTIGYLDSETYVTPYSFEVATCAAGAAITAVD